MKARPPSLDERVREAASLFGKRGGRARMTQLTPEEAVDAGGALGLGRRAGGHQGRREGGGRGRPVPRVGSLDDVVRPRQQ
jgi:hypothetical protein